MKKNSMKLSGISPGGPVTKIYFTSYLRSDFVERSLILTLKEDHQLAGIHFSSNEHGTVEWIDGTGLAGCHRWENEDEARSASYLSKHYTAVLLDGEETMDYARKRIIPDVLAYLPRRRLKTFIEKIVKEKKFESDLDPADFSIKIPEGKE